MNQFLKISLMGLGVLSLTACSVKKGPNGAPVTSAGGQNTGAQTYAMQQQAGYQSNRRGFYRNAMRAPANQIYYFSFDSSSMRSQDARALLIQANYLATHPNAQIRLEGNTDNRGSREYNIGLGWRRDQSVARMLEQRGVRPRQIKMVSYGKERPAVTGNNDRAWALNRRVNLIYRAR